MTKKKESVKVAPKDAFEMMVWERLYAACLVGVNHQVAAENADNAFEEYKKRHDAMVERFEKKNKE